MQGGSNMHHKFHTFGPAPPGPANPPGLVRIQPKPSTQPHPGPSHSSFPRMPQLTQGRSSDVSSSVSSTTHPIGENRWGSNSVNSTDLARKWESWSRIHRYSVEGICAKCFLIIITTDIIEWLDPLITLCMFSVICVGCLAQEGRTNSTPSTPT